MKKPLSPTFEPQKRLEKKEIEKVEPQKRLEKKRNRFLGP